MRAAALGPAFFFGEALADGFTRFGFDQVKPRLLDAKAMGEAAVLAAFPSAVILRPSVIFGPEDEFYNRFAGMARLSPVLPLTLREVLAPRLELVPLPYLGLSPKKSLTVCGQVLRKVALT